MHRTLMEKSRISIPLRSSRRAWVRQLTAPEGRPWNSNSHRVTLAHLGAVISKKDERKTVKRVPVTITFWGPFCF